MGGITKHIINYIWAIMSQTIMNKWFKLCISDLRSVSDWLNSRGYPCAKGYNSSASQWLSGEQVRLCLGYPKVFFGTIIEGSLGVGGAQGVLRVLSLSRLQSSMKRTFERDTRPFSNGTPPTQLRTNWIGIKWRTWSRLERTASATLGYNVHINNFLSK